MCIAPSWAKASAFSAWAFLSTAAPRCKVTDAGLVPATAETAARTSADTACCFGAGAWPKDFMLSLVMVGVSLDESRRAVGNSAAREGAASGDDATAAVAVDTYGVPDARRCTPVVGACAEVPELEVPELDVPELDKSFCRLSALTLADTEGLLVSEGACALGVSGICSESWSSFGDGSSTLVVGDTGAVGAAALAVSGAVGVVALGITWEVGEVVGASCAACVLVVGAWLRARSAGSGESKRGELDVGVLVTGVLETGVLVTGALAIGVLETGVLVTGVLVTGVLVTGVLVIGVLVVGAWVRARSAGSGESKRGVLETGALETGVLETGALETGALETGALVTGALVTGALVTGALETGALETGVLETGALGAGALATGPIVRDLVIAGAAPVGTVIFWGALAVIGSGCGAGLLITGAWLRAVSVGSGALALGALSKEPLGMGAGKPLVRWVSALRGSGAVTSLTGALTWVLSTGFVGGMITASRTGVAPGRDRTRRSCVRDGSLVGLSSITAEMSSRLNGFASACLAISDGIIGPWLRDCDWGCDWGWGCRWAPGAPSR